jgi:hypothetical protein
MPALQVLFRPFERRNFAVAALSAPQEQQEIGNQSDNRQI